MQLAIEFEVHLNSVRGWMRRWQVNGLVGLHEVERQDGIDFFDRLADTIAKKTVVVLDNAPIHRGTPLRGRA
jgi:hypothetical protein